MNLSQYINRRVVRLLMGLMLFAQWVMPASAYAAGDAAPMNASAMAQSGSMAAAMPCHGKQAPRAAACLTHCSQADQASLDHLMLAAAPVGAAGWLVAVPPVRNLVLPLGRSQVLLDSGPPIPIRFCSLLN